MKFEKGARVIVNDANSLFYVVNSEEPMNGEFKGYLSSNPDILSSNYIQGLTYEVKETYVIGTLNLCLLKSTHPSSYILIDEDYVSLFELNDDTRNFFRQVAKTVEAFGIDSSAIPVYGGWMPGAIPYETNKSGLISITVGETTNAE